MKSFKIPLTLALVAVPLFKKQNTDNQVKITCLLPEKHADRELDDLIDLINQDKTPWVEVVVEEDFIFSFQLFLSNNFEFIQPTIIEATQIPSDKMFIEVL